MPNQPSVEANFTGGLKTEFTGLNFPENAATDTDNCVYNIIGNVNRRLGFDFETNYTLTTIDRTAKALSSYKWNNAGGDGSTQVFVQQVGGTLHFYKSSAATTTDPISDQKLVSTIDLTSFVSAGGSFTTSKECTYADGNGYLFVFHPDMDPIYCTYVTGTITGALIDIKIRDFVGLIDNLSDTSRPAALTGEHNYNIQNQGWSDTPNWAASSSTTRSTTPNSSVAFTVASGLSITAAQAFTGAGFIPGIGNAYVSGTVVSYSGTTLTLNIVNSTYIGSTSSFWNFSHTTTSYISTFLTAAGGYPSNADVWWRYKDSTSVFAPSTTLTTVTANNSPAPKGHFVFSAFNQNRSAISSIASLTTVSTLVRPRIGAWFQGRVWYAGTDASFAASGDADYYTWSETIYFSQIVEKVGQLGLCHQVNDPTSEDLFDLLPSDGGTIRIQGCGKIYKLFPVQNGMLIHCANGIWFLTGSQGIGFAANDYTLAKLSGVEASNSTSFVSVQGWPMFWNDEGIYVVQPQQGGGMSVENICIGTIWQYYREIPLISKTYARGDYDPINYIVQWCFRSSNESSTTDRYEYDRILCLNLHNKAFYPYSLSGTPKIHDIRYIQSPGGSAAPEPVFKYITSYANSGSYKFTMSEERLTTYVDWDIYGTAVNYSSYFVTGYKLKPGMAQMKFQPLYVNVFANNEENGSYYIQGQWNYAINTNSGKYSVAQLATITESTANFGVVLRRFKIRGSGKVLQFKIYSVDGEPFDIHGWSVMDVSNKGL